jgi:Na+-translocating ferredoxin:NAD+ oxidoreductase RnfD subunit
MTYDPRYFQIITLLTLIVLQITFYDFAPEVSQCTANILAALLTQFLFIRFYKLDYDFKSPLITAMSISLLLKTSFIFLGALACVIAISSKFLIRFNKKHLFNPAALAIVFSLVVFPDYFWVSPGQWGTHLWLIMLISMMAFIVLHRIPKSDISLIFLVCYALILTLRALWLGDPMSIPLHQLQNGALLIFSFFMISDPKTTPDHFGGRAIFAISCALLAYIFQFELQSSEALFFALVITSLLTPALDKFLIYERYEWRKA